jgi:putative resolvase
MQHITPKEAAKILGVHVSSLRRWENEGKLKAIRTPGGQRRFILEEVEKIGGIPRTIKTICYGRVSTHSQQDEQRQLEHLRTRAFTVTHDSIVLSEESELTDAVVNLV